MAGRSRLVNLDAMIRRADFALVDGEIVSSFDALSMITLRDLAPGSLLPASLRKPDFQRETNHWAPEQVVSLLQCFVNGDLIPSVILWRSPTYLYVIDGGHRLSVLKAWIEDDYGDGPISQPFFGHAISDEQRKAAKRTRDLVKDQVGTWQHYMRMQSQELSEAELRKINSIVTRGLPVQWVQGNAEKAEASFFKINTSGTPLDEIEELLLSNRRKPIPIAARAIIRAGMGHKYWSSFAESDSENIESIARDVHLALFEPELNAPVKTLDLPLGGSKGVRTAMQVLLDFILIANRNQLGLPKNVGDQDEDTNGSATVHALKRTLALVNRMTGNDKGSLGLHPAIYFYGPTGRHVGPLFMGTASLFASKLANNDQSFFPKFSRIREKLENLLIVHKDLIATILQKSISRHRVSEYSSLLDSVIQKLDSGHEVSEEDMVTFANLNGKIIVGEKTTTSQTFSDDVKSAAFIKSALQHALKCPICGGYLDPNKSVSYDHTKRKQDGGLGTLENCQLTHPYCNQSVKN